MQTTIGNSPCEIREGTYRLGSRASKLRDKVFLAASEQAGLHLTQDLVNTAVFKTFLIVIRTSRAVSDSNAFLTRDNKTGNLFGATINGGHSNLGQLFEIDIKGKFTVLHSFKGSDGEFPGGLIINGSKILGAVGGGGDLSLRNSGCGVLFEMDTNGKNFKLLHTFKSTPDGSIPYIFLALDQGGRLCGTATERGDSSLCSVGCGTVYRLTLNATK